jgi:hypothetical protein
MTFTGPASARFLAEPHPHGRSVCSWGSDASAFPGRRVVGTLFHYSIARLFHGQRMKLGISAILLRLLVS